MSAQQSFDFLSLAPSTYMSPPHQILWQTLTAPSKAGCKSPSLSSFPDASSQFPHKRVEPCPSYTLDLKEPLDTIQRSISICSLWMVIGIRTKQAFFFFFYSQIGLGKNSGLNIVNQASSLQRFSETLTSMLLTHIVTFKRQARTFYRGFNHLQWSDL